MTKTPARAATVAAVTSVVLAFGAGALLAFYPCSTISVSERATLSDADEKKAVRTVECSSLLESQGAAILLILSIPPLLTIAGAAAARFSLPAPLWVVALLLFGLSILTGFSIGLFYMPSALALVVAAVLASTGRRSLSGLESTPSNV